MYLVRVILAFCHLQLILVATHGGKCREEKSHRGFALLNATYNTTITQHYPACVDLCFHDTQCMSFNFWWDARKCDLNSKAEEHSCRANFVVEPFSTYMGMARFPGYPALASSCSDLKKLDPTAESGRYIIDPDGEGGLPPLYDVTCDMIDKNGVGVTVISHGSQNRSLVDSCQARGCYSHDIHYTGASLSQLASLTRVSSHCEQFIKYECHHSVLLYNNNPYGWWVSRDSQMMMYWGGASGSGKCACGMTNSCADPKYGCNCDKNDNVWREDSGLLTNKTQLPVKQLRFGDTDRSGEQGYYTLGTFKCYGIV